MKTNMIPPRLLGCGVALLALTAQAHALEPQAFVERFEQVYSGIGYDIDLGEARMDGDDIVVSGGRFGISSAASFMEALEFDTEITFHDVVEENGSYRAKSATIPDIEMQIDAEPSGRLSLMDVRMDDIWLPAGDPVPMSGVVQLFRSFSTGPFLVERNGRPFVSYAGIQASSEFEPGFAVADLEKVSTLFAVRGLKLDMVGLAEEDRDFAEFKEILGVDEISGDIVQTMDWTMADGRMVVDEFEFDFPALGSFDIALDFSGLTLDVMQQAYDMQDAVVASGMEPSASEMRAQEEQAMALFGEIVPNSISIRYEEASLVGRLLDFFAEDNGMERSAFVAQAASVVEAGLAMSDIPGLAEIVGPAARAFLENPRSIEFSIAQSDPKSILELIVGAASGADLVQVLGLEAKANDQE